MKREEIKKLEEKRVQVFSRLKLRNIFPGEWESVYKGGGIEFAESRPLEPGDNPRDIDLLTLAQSGEEFIVERAETRQLKIYVAADYSGSMQCFEQMVFAQKPFIRDIAVGLILFSAVKVYSPISFYPFGIAETKFFPPKIGERYCWEILNWLSEENNLMSYTSSGVEKVLRALAQIAEPKNMVFFISDFKQKVFEGDFSVFLRKTVGKFDFIPVIILDPLEKDTRLSGSVRIKVQSSSAGGRPEEIYLTPDILQEMQGVSQKHLLNLEKNFKKCGVDSLILDSASLDDCCHDFSVFFRTRKKTTR